MSVRALKWAYFIMPQVKLHPSERLVLLSLCYHHHDKTNACFPSVETLMADTGFSERQVQYATKRLAEIGLIFVNKRVVRGHQGSNQYDLFGPVRGAVHCTPKGPQKSDMRGAGGGTLRGAISGVQSIAPDREEISPKGGRAQARKIRITHPQFLNRGPRDA